jgi:ABC-2 type transport system ATP-binding protein
MISLHKIKKTYNDKVALDIDFLNIKKGECVGIVGNNGAGKTTMFRAILDLIELDEGFVSIDGSDVAGSDHWKAILNAFIDESFLINFLKPLEYLNFVGKTLDLSREAVKEHLNGFKDISNQDIAGNSKMIRDLSTGSKIRVGLLAAFLGDPKIILLDEPFAHLDPSSQSRLCEILRLLHARGITILLSSHNLQNVLEVSDRIILIENGKVQQDQAVNETTHSQLSAYFK